MEHLAQLPADTTALEPTVSVRRRVSGRVRGHNLRVIRDEREQPSTQHRWVVILAWGMVLLGIAGAIIPGPTRVTSGWYIAFVGLVVVADDR